MAISMDGAKSEVERAFQQKFMPDAYELINVYKLYDEALLVEDHIEEVNAKAAAAAQAQAESNKNDQDDAAEALGE